MHSDQTGKGNMTTERQKAANQANALHSTGPKTQSGKAVVRLNALRHGVLARDVVLPGEDATVFQDLLNQVHAEFSPVGPIEELLVDRLVKLMWRLCRLGRVETALFDWRVRDLKVRQLAAEVSSYVAPVFSDSPDTYITDQTAQTEAQEALVRARQERDGDDVFLMPTPKRPMHSQSSVATKKAWNARSFEHLRSSAGCRTGAVAPHRPFWMPPRWSEAIRNDESLDDLR